MSSYYGSATLHYLGIRPDMPTWQEMQAPGTIQWRAHCCKCDKIFTSKTGRRLMTKCPDCITSYDLVWRRVKIAERDSNVPIPVRRRGKW